MKLPRTWFRLQTALLLIAVFGVIFAWPGRWAYEKVLRRMAFTEIQEQGGRFHYGEGGYAMSFGKASPVSLKLFKDADSIDLVGIGASDADLAPLRDSQTLVALNLTGCRITDAGLVCLKNVSNLKYLFLGETMVTDDGMKQLSGFGNLEIIVLDNTRIGDSGMVSLSRLSKLRQLALWGTEVSDRGASVLSGSTSLKSIALPRKDVGGSVSVESLEGLPGVAVYRKPTPSMR